MYFPVVAVLVALLIGYALGGRFGNLGSVRVRHLWLMGVAVLLLVVAAVVSGGGFGPVHGLAAAAFLVFLGLNLSVPGAALFAVGLLCNVAAVAANGAMPVSGDAAGRAGKSTQPLLTGTDPRHELAGSDTRLRWLTDVIPAPLPYDPQVLSPGDLLIAASMGELVVVGMGRRRAVARLTQPIEEDT